VIADLKEKFGCEVMNELGAGAFGRVFKGTLNGKTVAVKILKRTFDHTILREYSSHR